MGINPPLNRKLRMGLIGGGQGAFLAELLKRHPHLTRTMLDLPRAIAAAPETARRSFPPTPAFHAAPLDDLESTLSGHSHRTYATPNSLILLPQRRRAKILIYAIAILIGYAGKGG